MIDPAKQREEPAAQTKGAVRDGGERPGAAPTGTARRDGAAAAPPLSICIWNGR